MSPDASVNQRSESTLSRAIDYWSDQTALFENRDFESGSRHPEALGRLLHRLEIHHALTMLKPRGDESLIDMGAGHGRWTVALASQFGQITAVEPSGLYELLRRRTRELENVRCVNLRCSEFEGEPADVVLVSGVLMYLDEKGAKEFIARAARLVKPGGQLILREPLSSRNRLRTGRKYGTYQKGPDLRGVKYWEFLRTLTWYRNECAVCGLMYRASRVCHPTFLYYLADRLPYGDRLKRTVLEFVGDSDNWSRILDYDRLIHKPYGWWTRSFSERAFWFLQMRK
jgi:SAM-dependent methyltransferase